MTYREPSLAWYFHRSTSHGFPMAPGAPTRPGGRLATVPLPPPRPAGAPLGPLLATRMSCRRFTRDALSQEELSTVLHAAYGVGGHFLLDGVGFDARPVPSAGARYPLDLHLLVRAAQDITPGAYRYIATDHALLRTGAGADPETVARLFLDQPYLAGAAVVIVIVGALDMTMARYGDRGYRYVLFESGHVGQNVGLAAGALALGVLHLGGFFDEELAAVLGLDAARVPLYGVAIGRPEPGADLRAPQY